MSARFIVINHNLCVFIAPLCPTRWHITTETIDDAVSHTVIRIKIEGSYMPLMQQFLTCIYYPSNQTINDLIRNLNCSYCNIDLILDF